VIAVAQPHRFTRLRDLMDEFQNCFNDADLVYVTPVYTAGEDPIEGIDSAALAAGLKSRGHRSAGTVADQTDLAKVLASEIAAGDIVVCLGAGDITRWAAGLAGSIEQARGG
ncbi:MAG: UDP-N-acetylmuramate--L-alanine ligase, partial [Sphingomonadales bacterium]